MSAWLETNSGGKIPLQGSCSLGRDPSSTVVLPGNQVSRRHAMIHTQGGGEHLIVDLGSSNGVMLNGRRVRQPVALKDLDKLEIGPNVLVFRKADSQLDATMITAEKTSLVTVRSSTTANLWLLVADIEQFTPLSQTMPGEQLAKLVGKWILTCKEIIEKNLGEINKYLGDGFLAYWPASDIHVEAIASTLAELKQFQATSTLKFRVAVHFGSVTVNNSLAEGENSLIGPDVNFIFRIEKTAGGIQQYCVLSEAAAAQLKKFGPTIAQGEHQLPGFTGLHSLYSY